MSEGAAPRVPSSYQLLLPTGAEEVPAAHVAALAAFCADAPEIERGYVGAVEVRRPDADPERKLKFCVKLKAPVGEPEDSRTASRELMGRLAQSHLQAARELGVGVMADRAVPTWDAKALRIYPR